MDRGSGDGPTIVDGRPVAGVGEEEEVPACQSCRKRKLRCSREMPSCSQCSRLARACVYDHKKQKPGIKSGAVENLNKRIEVLEKILLDNNGAQKSLPFVLDAQGRIYPIANELEIAGAATSDSVHDEDSANDCASSVALRLNYQRQSPHTYADATVGTPSQVNNLPKKRRYQGLDYESLERSWENSDEDALLSPLPSASLLEVVVDMYFVYIHYWIPCVHETRFRTRLKDPLERPKLGVLLHAMVASAMKYVNVEGFGVDEAKMKRQVRVSRNTVTLSAMNSLSVENLQALIVVAFDNMGRGQVSKAWSIIGSLTRTVEYLQLTIEPGERRQHQLLQPLILVDKSKNWADAEERRRVFWNVFLLDRFCSVTSGWNTSLTSDDVRRRLPCDGGTWARDEQAVTPYFGIWDKSAAKIGNSIAHIPAHIPPQNDYDQSNNGGLSDIRSGSAAVDISKLGAFAYRIEATESLSQVTSFFLQQRVNFRNRQEVGSWLTRFKELDLRLVHWKMFLPQRWKDSNVSGDATLIKMDPNLTLAHLTHNTSMILLHQHIAYPPVNWSEVVKLPSSCSTETCQLAAAETAFIAQKYLTYTDPGIVTSQFAFSAFVAARVILVHWRFNNAGLAPEFFILIESLQEMSRRWQGYQGFQFDYHKSENGKYLDLAGKYALHLQELHEKCLNDANFRLDILGSSDSDGTAGSLLPSLAIPPRPRSLSSQRPRQSPKESVTSNNYAYQQNFNHYSPGMVNSPGTNFNFNHGPPSSNFQPSHSGSISSDLHLAYGLQRPGLNTIPSPPNNISTNGDNASGPRNSDLMNFNYVGEHVEDELTAMSHILLGQQFLEMDRVITLDGTDFNVGISNWGNMT